MILILSSLKINWFWWRRLMKRYVVRCHLRSLKFIAGQDATTLRMLTILRCWWPIWCQHDLNFVTNIIPLQQNCSEIKKTWWCRSKQRVVFLWSQLHFHEPHFWTFLFLIMKVLVFVWTTDGTKSSQQITLIVTFRQLKDRPVTFSFFLVFKIIFEMIS